MASSNFVPLLFLIMTQYSNKSILKALFFAPIFIQVLFAILFITLNDEFSMQSILTVCGINLIIYMLYCVIVIPIAYAISVLLARQYWLNFFTIMLGSVLMWLIVTIIGYLVFIGSLPTSISESVSTWYFYVIVVFVSCCYWGMLHFLNKKTCESKS